MNLYVLSVYDSKAEAYIQPLFAQTIAVGQRMFAQAANEEDHAFHMHAADFTLFALGVFDQDTGLFDLSKAPYSLGNALQYITQPLPPAEGDAEEHPGAGEARVAAEYGPGALKSIKSTQ